MTHELFLTHMKKNWRSWSGLAAVGFLVWVVVGMPTNERYLFIGLIIAVVAVVIGEVCKRVEK